MSNTKQTTVITVETTVNAAIEKVWKYWTEPQHVTQWNNASADWHTTKAENDLREGGHFSFTMAAKDGSFSFDFGGTYTLVKNLQAIEYTLGDGREVKVTFGKTPEGIKIVEHFEAESQNPVEMQKGGWQAIMDNFKAYTEKH